MRSLLALTILGAAMAFCNLGDLMKKDSGSSSEPARPVASTPKPLDKDALKSELLKMENDMTEAALNGDITLLAKNTTDDFELTGVDGKIQNKNEALADVKRETKIRSFSLTDAELVSASEENAVLRYTMNVTLKSGQHGSARVTDTFVKKDGRWLVKSEQATMMKR
jgi:hypothetical protein